MRVQHQKVLMRTTLLVACALVLVMAQPASAVPSFARKYQTSCMTCHVAPPKLNAFGRAFKNAGYRMPAGDAELVKQPVSALGAPGWKRVWPKGIWPADIPGGTMLGFVVESNYTVNNSSAVTNEFSGIEEIGLLLGGTVGESFSFFGDIDLFEGNEPGHIGRLFVQYNNPSHLFNVKVGQFEPRAAPFSSHLRLIRQTNYLANILPTIPTGNLFGFAPNQKGIEIWGGREGPGGKGGLIYAFGVVNGEAGGAAHLLEHALEEGEGGHVDEEVDTTGGEFDVNSGKDVYFSASYKFGGLGVFGSGSGDTLKQVNNWRDNSFTIGAYVYRGTTGADLLVPEPIGHEEEEEEGEHSEGEGEEHVETLFSPTGNTFYRVGVKFDWWFKDLNLFGGYQLNRDRLRDGRVFDIGISTLEANYVTPWPWIQPGLRFESVNPDFGSSFNRTTLSTTLLLRANVILALEGSLSRSDAPLLPPFDDQFTAQLRFLF